MAGFLDQDFWDYMRQLQEPGQEQQLAPLAPFQAPPGSSFMPPPSGVPNVGNGKEAPPFDPNAWDRRQRPPGESPLMDQNRPMQQASMGGGQMPMGIGPMGGGGGGGGGGLLSGLFGGGGQQQSTGGRPWGPMLMALGGGIAGGAQQGWGAGIGAGLMGAANARQNQSELNLKERAYQNQLEQSKTEQARWEAQFGLQKETAKNTFDTRQDAIEERRQTRFDKEQKLTGPINMIAAVADQYPTIRSTLTDPTNSWMDWKAGQATETGEIARSLSLLKSSIYGAAAINGDNPEQTWEAMRPTGPKDAEEKLKAIESYMTGVGSGLSGNETQAKSLAKFSQFKSADPTPQTDEATGETLPPGAKSSGEVEAGAAGAAHKYKSGDTVVKGGKTYEKGPDGLWYPKG